MLMALRKRETEDDAIERAVNGIVDNLNLMVKMISNQNS